MSSLGVEVKVECYSGYRGEETPLVVVLGVRRVPVTEVVSRWLGPEHRYFKVRCEDEAIYTLRQNVETGRWELVGHWSCRHRSPQPP